MKNTCAMYLVILLTLCTFVSCDSAEPVSEEESLFSSLACEELIQEQNYTAWCGSDGSGLKATAIGSSDTACGLFVNYRDSELPAYSVNVQLMGSPQAARIFVDNLPSDMFQKIQDVAGVGDQAVYFETPNTETTKAFVARSSNVVVTVAIAEIINPSATCYMELPELKFFTDRLLRNL